MTAPEERMAMAKAVKVLALFGGKGPVSISGTRGPNTHTWIFWELRTGGKFGLYRKTASSVLLR